MRIKRLNHYADLVCRMFVGWRMGDDLEVMSDLPGGTITVNLLTGQSHHSINGNLNLHIGEEIQAWLQQQSAKEGIDISKVNSAILEVDIDTSKVATNKKKFVLFHFACRSNIRTSDATYAANVIEAQQWHTRLAT